MGCREDEVRCLHMSCSLSFLSGWKLLPDHRISAEVLTESIQTTHSFHLLGCSKEFWTVWLFFSIYLKPLLSQCLPSLSVALFGMLLAYSLGMALYSRVSWERKEVWVIIFLSGMPALHTCGVYSPQASFQDLRFFFVFKIHFILDTQGSNLDLNSNYPLLWFLLVFPPSLSAPSFSLALNPEPSQMQSHISSLWDVLIVLRHQETILL